jgi:type I restriction enzyme M protein
MAFDEADSQFSKVFDTREFGYWEVPVYTPRYDENGAPILDKKGNPVKPNSDKEQVPFTYEGGIDAFMEQEVMPYAPDAFRKPGTEKVGYELSFTKYFYQPVQLRTLDEITADIRAIEAETDGLLDEILGG